MYVQPRCISSVTKCQNSWHFHPHDQHESAASSARLSNHNPRALLPKQWPKTMAFTISFHHTQNYYVQTYDVMINDIPADWHMTTLYSMTQRHVIIGKLTDWCLTLFFRQNNALFYVSSSSYTTWKISLADIVFFKRFLKWNHKSWKCTVIKL